MTKHWKATLILITVALGSLATKASELKPTLSVPSFHATPYSWVLAITPISAESRQAGEVILSTDSTLDQLPTAAQSQLVKHFESIKKTHGMMGAKLHRIYQIVASRDGKSFSLKGFTASGTQDFSFNSRNDSSRGLAFNPSDGRKLKDVKTVATVVQQEQKGNPVTKYTISKGDHSEWILEFRDDRALPIGQGAMMLEGSRIMLGGSSYEVLKGGSLVVGSNDVQVLGAVQLTDEKGNTSSITGKN